MGRRRFGWEEEDGSKALIWGREIKGFSRALEFV